MAKTPSSNGKGSARRTENLAKVRENWDSIDWSKGRPAAKQLKQAMGETTGRILSEEYDAKTEWTVPAREELLPESGFVIIHDPIKIEDTFYSNAPKIREGGLRSIGT